MLRQKSKLVDIWYGGGGDRISRTEKRFLPDPVEKGKRA